MSNRRRGRALAGIKSHISPTWLPSQERLHGANLLLHWTESSGPATAAPVRKGFGVDALDGMVRTLSGKITRQLKPEGLDRELSFPGIEG